MSPDPLSAPGAPAPGTLLCSLADLANPGARSFEFRDGTSVFELFLVRMGAAVYAYVNACPHRGTPLDWVPGRFFTADGTELLCATHGATFRIEDGVCTGGPCPGRRLTPVPLMLSGGEIRIGPSAS